MIPALIALALFALGAPALGVAWGLFWMLTT